MNIKGKLSKFIEKRPRKYFNLDQLEQYIQGDDLYPSRSTLKQYLSNHSEIYSAGQGWYSTIEQEYNLKTGPIQEFVEKLEQKFPYLEFCVWSIRQISSHFHHLPGKFLTFVYAEKNTEDAVRDFLVEDDLHVYLDPTPEEIEKQFQFERDTYIVRTSLTEEPKKEHFARIEKILVDVFVEKDKFNFIGESEYEHIFLDILTQSRVNIAKLLRYGKVRNIRTELTAYVHKIAEGNWMGYS